MVATSANDIAALYEQERTTLTRSAARLVGPDHAQDLVHDAFLTYLTKPPAADRPGAWLSRVTRNRALNELRRVRVVSLEEDAPHDARVGERAERHAVQTVLARALIGLPERYRRALELRYLQGEDYDVVAEDLGVSVAQAHVVLHRATRRLGRELVRGLAQPHRADACVPAIERMLGFTTDATDHADEPCDACAPVMDELHSLRAAPVFIPAVGLLQRVVAWINSHGPALAEPAATVASLALAFGLSVSPPIATPPQPAAAHARPAPVVHDTPRAKTTKPAPVQKQTSARIDEPTKRTTQQIATKDRPVEASGVNVSNGSGSTQVEGAEGTDAWTGVAVCGDPTAASCEP
jgi:RNA polymerase sigma factor (sigma-70 family)